MAASGDGAGDDEGKAVDGKVAYLRGHQVPQLLDELVTALTAEKPEDPVAWIKAWSEKEYGRRKSLKEDAEKKPDAPAEKRPGTGKAGQLAPEAVKSPQRSPRGIALVEPDSEGRGPVPTNLDKDNKMGRGERKGGKAGGDQLKRRHFFEATSVSLRAAAGAKASPRSRSQAQLAAGAGSMLQCTHLGCLCVALSLLLRSQEGQEDSAVVTLEDLFFTLQLPLHLVDQAGATVSELHDLAMDYVARDARFSNLLVAKLNLDTGLHDGEVTVGMTGFDEGGPRGPVVSLSKMREKLAKESVRLDVCRVISYDPFILDEGQKRWDDGDEDEDLEDRQMTATAQAEEHAQRMARWQMYRNRGQMSLVQEYSGVKHEVVLRDVYPTDDGGLQTHEKAVPLKLLHKACTALDGENDRPRGWLVCYTKSAQQKDESPEDGADCIAADYVPSYFDPRLVLGSGRQGTLLTNVHPHISPHLTATAAALHLLHGQDEQGTGQLGVDVGAIVRKLSLPLAMVCDNDMELSAVHNYADRYIAASEHAGKVAVSLHPIEVRNPWDESAAPNVSVTELSETFLAVAKRNSDPHKPKVALLLNFDVNAAHNVLGLERGSCRSHYGILAGYDEDGDIVKVMDTVPKKFKRYWETPLTRMHAAMFGRGFLVFNAVGSELEGCEATARGAPRQTTAPAPYDQKFLTSFPFPPQVFVATAIALSLTRLRRPCVASHVATGCSFDISFALSDKLSLFDAQRVAQYYIRNDHDSAVTVTANPMDRPGSGMSTAEELAKKLAELWEQDKEGKTVTLLSYAHSILFRTFGTDATWGGDYGLMTSYDAEAQRVSILDVNRAQFQRTWTVAVADLYRAMCSPDGLTGRRRGFLRFEEAAWKPPAGRGLMATHATMQHPFRVPPLGCLSCVAFALSELGLPSSAEDILYLGYKALLPAEVDERSPWRDAPFRLAGIRQNMPLPDAISVATCYIQCDASKSRVKSALTVERVEVPGTAAELCALVEPATKPGADGAATVIAALAYRPEDTHEGIGGAGLATSVSGQGGPAGEFGVGFALVDACDAAAGTLRCVDVAPTRYGETWERSAEALLHSCRAEAQNLHGILLFRAAPP